MQRPQLPVRSGGEVADVGQVRPGDDGDHPHRVDAPDGVAVRSGLKPGDWVVIAGGHLLHEGQAVLPVDRSNRPVAAN